MNNKRKMKKKKPPIIRYHFCAMVRIHKSLEIENPKIGGWGKWGMTVSFGVDKTL
jgi:hypothetical protein